MKLVRSLINSGHFIFRLLYFRIFLLYIIEESNMKCDKMH